MSDVFTAAKRSKVMSKIRGSGNRSTELRAMELFRKGNVHGWRRGFVLLGKPDFAFPANRLAVFVDGCFWHGCPRHYKTPSSNAGFWRTKIARNRMRDREVGRQLRAKGWKVIRIWEHQLRTNLSRATVLARVVGAIQQPAPINVFPKSAIKQL